MIMNDPKRKTVSIILGQMGDAKADPENEGEMDDVKVIAGEMLRAMKSGSEERLAQALQAFADMIARDDEMQDQEER